MFQDSGAADVSPGERLLACAMGMVHNPFVIHLKEGLNPSVTGAWWTYAGDLLNVFLHHTIVLLSY